MNQVKNLLWKKEGNNPNLFVDLDKKIPIDLASISCDGLIDNLQHINRKDERLSLAFYVQGKKLLMEKKYSEAMNYFDLSLCHVKKSTCFDSLYFDRSYCFFELKMFDKCLIDIELAKRFSDSPMMRQMLDELHWNCSKHIELVKSEQSETSENDEIKLSYETDENFPGMANVLEIKYDKTYGRHMVAKCDIPVGKVVLVENPFSSNSDTYLMCTVCMKETMNFVPCSKCSRAMFCSDLCANATSNIHKMECGEMSENISNGLYVRTILEAIRIFPNINDLMKFVDDAVNDKEKLPPKSLNDRKAQY